MKKIIITIAVIIVIAGFTFLILRSDEHDTPNNTPPATSGSPTGFSPFGGNPITNGEAPQATTTGEFEPTPISENPILPRLRLLSNNPIGGFGASTTGSTTIIRWVDRGRGNINQVDLHLPGQSIISNTIVSKVIESVWNKNLTSFVGAKYINDYPSFIFAELKKLPQATSTETGVERAEYELIGKTISQNITGVAVNPTKDKVFLFTKEGTRGIGYVANFDGSKMTQIIDVPMTLINVEWPETNTIAITTKGIASQSGFLYFVNPTTGSMKKVLGPIFGLSTKVSRDAKYVFASSAANNGGVDTAVVKVDSGATTDAIVRTLADKCAWGNFYKNIVYCAVPSVPPRGNLPDDWYKGSTSFVDKVWQINAETGETKLISTIIEDADRSIDAFNLVIDNRDEFLTFMNKSDLSLWSLDLVTSQ